MSATAVVPAEQRTLLREITWETYERLLDERGETSVPRLTYDRGVLEIMSPGKRHETLASLVTLLVGVVSEEWGVAVTDLGSMTFKNPEWDRGFEPDGCFYVGDAAEAVMPLERIDPSVDPAPDVVVEIDISHDSTDKRDLRGTCPPRRASPSPSSQPTRSPRCSRSASARRLRNGSDTSAPGPEVPPPRRSPLPASLP